MTTSISLAKLATVFLPLLTSTLVAAQDDGPYCGAGSNPMPNIDNCRDAINKIPTGNTETTEYDAGDCAVKALAIDGSTLDLSGQAVIDAANSILNLCGPNGWTTAAQANVSIEQCQVCMYGTCAVCDAPTTRRRSVPLLRRESPAPGVTCEAGAAAHVGDCRGTYGAMSGMQLSLPFQTTNGACTVVLEPRGQNIVIDGDDPVGRIDNDLNLCESAGPNYIVGKVVDNNADNYDIIFGNLCGEYGQGEAGCTP